MLDMLTDKYGERAAEGDRLLYEHIKDEVIRLEQKLVLLKVCD